MSSPYDESLLASAPKATKAQLQDGYNPDLFEKTSSTPTTSLVNPETASHRLTAAIQPVTKKKTPFYATKNVIIVVLVIVIITIVVGGVVGGTRKKKSLDSSSTLSTALPSTTSSSIQRSGTEQGGPESVNQGSASIHPIRTVNRTVPAIPGGCRVLCDGEGCCIPS